MSYDQHVRGAQTITARCAVLTLSDTRTEETDKSGRRMRELLEADGHAVMHYQVLPDEPAALAPALDGLLARADVDAVLTNGGTGISRRDQTIGVIEQRLAPPLAGFGELFRMLSFEEIGAAAMLSRATAGIAGGRAIFLLPGSEAAVRLAMERLILPELGHIAGELTK